ncbi:MAG: hypothetical protein HUJ98_14210 [Bacteroidaceae bacterium]|nr:hypothetical protein [Bacteroidaceae bacterium]
MTPEQKEDLIAKMIDQPHTLTTSEMGAILDDDELKGLYTTAVELKNAATPTKNYDVNQEWETFKPRLTKHRNMAVSYRRWAAALVVLLSVGATATITHLAMGYNPLEAAIDYVTESLSATNLSNNDNRLGTVSKEEKIQLKETLVFANTTLKEIAQKTAELFQCEVKIENAEKEGIRLYVTLPVGSTVSDFMAVIDAYDALSVSYVDNVVLIK